MVARSAAGHFLLNYAQTKAMSHSTPYPDLGFGLGLRHPHYDYILQNQPDVGWFEIISENYLSAHSGYWDFLSEIKSRYPIIMHGVSLSIGSTDPLDTAYLSRLKALADHLDAPFVSDHLCYTGISGENTHDLLPIPYSKAALEHIIPRILAVQEAIKRPFILENASSYLEWQASDQSEPEFLRILTEKTGCGLLLDINNVYVSCFNHGWDAYAYIDAIPQAAIAQYHLAGHTNKVTYLVDTHNDFVTDAVWDLYRYTLKTKGPRATMVEWDADIPEFPVLMAELDKARSVAASAKGAGV